MTTYLAATLAQSTLPPFLLHRAIRASASSSRSLVNSASSSDMEPLPDTFGRCTALGSSHPVGQRAPAISKRKNASSNVRPCVRTGFTASSRSSGVFVLSVS